MPELIDQAVEEHLPALQAPLEGRLVPSPYHFLFTGEDALRVCVHNAVSGVVVAVHYRMQTPKGGTVANAHTFTPSSDRSMYEQEIAIGEGYLLNVVAFASSGSPRIGQTFVKVDVIRGRGTSATVLATILQDYITARQPVAWPGSPIRTSFDGGGVIRLVSGTDPPAGSEWSETVPAGARWQVLSICAQLTASAVAATRQPRISIESGGTYLLRFAGRASVGASQVLVVTWATGITPETVPQSAFAINYCPATIILLAGDSINSNTDLMDPGDNWTGPRIYVREWLEVS